MFRTGCPTYCLAEVIRNHGNGFCTTQLIACQAGTWIQLQSAGGYKTPMALWCLEPVTNRPIYL
jgi:hypothetical protein